MTLPRLTQLHELECRLTLIVKKVINEPPITGQKPLKKWQVHWYAPVNEVRTGRAIATSVSQIGFLLIAKKARKPWTECINDESHFVPKAESSSLNR
jgi:hypothetical protein